MKKSDTKTVGILLSVLIIPLMVLMAWLIYILVVGIYQDIGTKYIINRSVVLVIVIAISVTLMILQDKMFKKSRDNS